MEFLFSVGASAIGVLVLALGLIFVAILHELLRLWIMAVRIPRGRSRRKDTN